MKKILFLFLFAAFCAYGVLAQQNDLLPAATLRLTREEPITVRQVRAEVDRLQAVSGQTLTAANRKEVLDVMINERLVLQAAARDRITVTDNEINQRLSQFRELLANQLGRAPTDAEFAQAVRNDYNMEVAAFRTWVQNQLIMEKYLTPRVQTLLNSTRPPTEAEIAEYYSLVRADLSRPETARFTTIMVPYGQDAASRTAARQLADRLRGEIGSDPAKFDEAVQKSIAPNSGYEAGDAGYIYRNQEARAAIGQTLLDAVFSTRQGQISNVIEGLQGYFIIKVTENHAPKLLELDDIMYLGTRVTVRDYIGQGLYAEKQQSLVVQATEELVSELRNAGTVRYYEERLNW